MADTVIVRAATWHRHSMAPRTGATYNLKDEEAELRDSDHQTNLSHLCDFGAEWETAANSAEIIGGRGAAVQHRLPADGGATGC